MPMTAIKYMTPDSVDNMFNKIEDSKDNFWKISEIRKNAKKLIAKKLCCLWFFG